MHKLYKTQPSELRGDKLMGFKVTWVASNLVVMTLGEDGSIEGVLQGDVNMTFVYKDVIVILPV